MGLDASVVLSPARDLSILALDEALTTFSQLAPRQAKVVELVAALKISPRTVGRDRDLTRAWLLRELSHTPGDHRASRHDS